ncbi:MAG: copper chaperone PCu(A)C [Sphingomonadaceae bacterium]
MLTERKIGLSACVIAVLLLGLSVFAGQRVESAPTASGASKTEAAGLTVSGAWIRLPAASGRPAGGYLTIANSKIGTDALVRVTSSDAERIELHSMRSDQGVMRMRQEQSLAVPEAGTLRLAPGGKHLMLFGLASDVRAGGKLPLTLYFESGVTVDVTADVQAPGSDAPAGHHHH